MVLSVCTGGILFALWLLFKRVPNSIETHLLAEGWVEVVLLVSAVGVASIPVTVLAMEESFEEKEDYISTFAMLMMIWVLWTLVALPFMMLTEHWESGMSDWRNGDVSSDGKKAGLVFLSFPAMLGYAWAFPDGVSLFVVGLVNCPYVVSVVLWRLGRFVCGTAQLVRAVWRWVTDRLRGRANAPA